MVDKNIQIQAEQFCEQWQGLNHIYEDYARTVNIPYTTLYILNLITKIPNCTQKDICEAGLLPRQTVNTVITSFYKQDLVELRELPEDRRIKRVYLTEKGKAYADSVLPQIHQAEYEAMAQIPEAQREFLLSVMKRYCEIFRKTMFEKK